MSGRPIDEEQQPPPRPAPRPPHPGTDHMSKSELKRHYFQPSVLPNICAICNRSADEHGQDGWSAAPSPPEPMSKSELTKCGPLFPDANQQEAYTIEDGLRPSPPVGEAGELARQLRFLATCPNMPTSQLLSAAALIEQMHRMANVRPKDCPSLNHCLAAINGRDSQKALIEQMQEALKGLANAADDAGVKFFDTDTTEPEVARLQEATSRARALIEAE